MAKNATADVGMIGLGVMGSNLAWNIADRGFRVAVWNYHPERVDEFLAADEPSRERATGTKSLRRFVASIERPRRIVMLIKAGEPVDSMNRKLLPLLDAGDVVVDGGNSLWSDTERRQAELGARGVHFLGSGVSGGEVGARFGPSLMVGGSAEGWRRLRPVWNAIAARVDRESGRPLEGGAPGKPIRGGVPCAARVGDGGSGHYVKMVHNGIEYADMQLISEAYFLFVRLLGLSPDAIAEIFSTWNQGALDSYLIEITADLLKRRDPLHPRRFLVDSILDTAGQKGTGKWTSASALDLGVAAPTIAQAVFARFLSALKDERVAAAKSLRGPAARFRGAEKPLVADVHAALYASKIAAYAQGFALMRTAAAEYGWKLHPGKIAEIWRGGCIIRARLLPRISSAYEADRKLANLMLDPSLRRDLHRAQAGWRRTVATAAVRGVPCPAFMSALAYFDGYRSGRLPANLLQAQRDYFGAHTFERTDRPRGTHFHADWSNRDDFGLETV